MLQQPITLVPFRVNPDRFQNPTEEQLRLQPPYFFYDGSSTWKVNSNHVSDNSVPNDEPSTSTQSDENKYSIKKQRKTKNYEALSRIENARSGPWTMAEQIYAMKIMDEFEAGRLPEIPPKWTLRVLLAHKLKCHKMRISKKFGGRCRGKIPYKNYLKNNPANEVTDMAMLRRFELDFLASIEDLNAKNKDGDVHIAPSSFSGLPMPSVQATALNLYNEAIRTTITTTTTTTTTITTTSSNTVSRKPSTKRPKKEKRIQENTSTNTISSDFQQVPTTQQPNMHGGEGGVSSSNSCTIAVSGSNDNIIGTSTSSSSNNGTGQNDMSAKSPEFEEVDPLPRIRKLFNPFIDSFYNDCVPVVHVSDMKHV